MTLFHASDPSEKQWCFFFFSALVSLIIIILSSAFFKEICGISLWMGMEMWMCAVAQKLPSFISFFLTEASIWRFLKWILIVFLFIFIYFLEVRERERETVFSWQCVIGDRALLVLQMGHIETVLMILFPLIRYDEYGGSTWYSISSYEHCSGWWNSHRYYLK